jgi:diadenosine tetraphosphate (Ap4A) HIT family hydrolase
MSEKNKDKKEYVDLRFARFDDQKKVMEKIIEEGHCPFCGDNLFKYHKKEILKDGKYWILTYIQWPREHTRVHLLAIYKPHAESLSDLDSESGLELFEYMKWAEKKFGVKGGAFALRFGDTSYSGGSVRHLHVQFMVPDIDSKDYEPVRFKVGR